MKYAKYISNTTIITEIPKKGYDEQGHLVTGGLENRPDVLKLLNFYPLIEQDIPSEVIEGYHYEKRYSPPENDTITQTWVSVENPPDPPQPINVYSKLKILIAADEAGFSEDLMDLIESDRKISYIWNASNTIEDNELLSQYMPSIATALGKTEREIRLFLNTYCLAD